MGIGRIADRGQLKALNRFHLTLLLAVAFVIKIVSRRDAWRFWMSRALRASNLIFRNHARMMFRVFGSRLIEVALDDYYWMPSILLGHENEPEIQAVLSKVLSPDAFFIDAGANIGWWSLFASTMIADPARIVAIEPAANTFGDLNMNAWRNGMCFSCVRAAVWDRSGETLPLLFAESTRQSAHIVWQGTLWNLPAGQEEIVQSVCIDEIIDANYEHVRRASSLVLKLDVEGSELHALDGARKHLSDFDLIIYEDHGMDAGAQVTAEILSRGVAVFSADRHGLLSPVESVAVAQSIKRNPGAGYNFFALPPGSRLLTMLGIAPSPPTAEVGDSRQADPPPGV